MGLEKWKTCELLKELENREAVEILKIEPYKSLNVEIDGNKQVLQVDKGPACLVLVWD